MKVEVFCLKRYNGRVRKAVNQTRSPHTHKVLRRGPSNKTKWKHLCGSTAGNVCERGGLLINRANRRELSPDSAVPLSSAEFYSISELIVLVLWHSASLFLCSLAALVSSVFFFWATAGNYLQQRVCKNPTVDYLSRTKQPTHAFSN